jgi:hypothetical protein
MGYVGRLSLGFLLVSCFSAFAQVIAPSGWEVSFQYSAQFILGSDDAEQAAFDHSQYMSVLEGIGGARLPLTIKVNSVKQDEDGRTVVSYQTFGRLLMHKQAVKRAGSELVLRLPYDLDRVYLKKCTDEHYDSFGDYWYFWDPYREGCERLLEPGRTREVRLSLKPITSIPAQDAPDFSKLRGDNGNGEVLSVYILNGFNENSSNSKDEGRQNFEQIRGIFEERGYRIEELDRSPRIPRNRYVKELKWSGVKMTVEVIHQLANTSIDADAKTFARTFKDAVENGDIVAYLGHSGLGSNLDIPSLNYKLQQMGEGELRFNKSKYQIFFFDACSSYSYYLPHFRDVKTPGSIDIVSYGLSSYFHTSTDVFAAFTDKLMTLDKPESWESILRAMERPLEGTTYLLNVGGL